MCHVPFFGVWGGEDVDGIYVTAAQLRLDDHVVVVIRR